MSPQSFLFYPPGEPAEDEAFEPNLVLSLNALGLPHLAVYRGADPADFLTCQLLVQLLPLIPEEQRLGAVTAALELHESRDYRQMLGWQQTAEEESMQVVVMIDPTAAHSGLLKPRPALPGSAKAQAAERREAEQAASRQEAADAQALEQGRALLSHYPVDPPLPALGHTLRVQLRPRPL